MISTSFVGVLTTKAERVPVDGGALILRHRAAFKVRAQMENGERVIFRVILEGALVNARMLAYLIPGQRVFISGVLSGRVSEVMGHAGDGHATSTMITDATVKARDLQLTGKLGTPGDEA